MTTPQDGPPDPTPQPEPPPDPASPWWVGLGPVGAVASIALGICMALWLFWADTAQIDYASGYYQAAKVIALGLVMGGTALLGRLGARAKGAAGTEEAREEREEKGEQGEQGKHAEEEARGAPEPVEGEGTGRG